MFKKSRKFVSVFCSSMMVMSVFSVGLQNVQASTRLYKDEATRLSSNANLAGVYGVKLNETFDKNKTQYTANVDNEVRYLYNLDGRTESDGARLYIENRFDPLKEGKNVVKLDVRAEDGTQKVYTLVVTRAKSTRSLSSNANLTSVYGLKLNEPFHKNKTDYTADVENEVRYLYDLGGRTENNRAKVYVQNRYGLKEGKNVVKLEVQAEDGTRKVYTVVVTRKVYQRRLSSNANLTNVYGLKLNEPFHKNKTDYTADVANEVRYLYDLGGRAENNGARVYVQNGYGLKEGKNVVKLEVQAEDGTRKVYTVVVTRAGSKRSLSSNANLTNVYGLKLNEPFHKNKTEYTADVANEVRYLYGLDGRAEDYRARVFVENRYAPLKEGKNVVKLDVQAEDGTRKVYTVVVTRKVYQRSLSSNANLTRVYGLRLNEMFHKNRTEYTAYVDSGVRYLYELNGVAEDSRAQVYVDGKNKLLKEGKNVVKLNVRAEDGTEKTYTITVTKLSSNANVTSIRGVTLNEKFDKNVLEYGASVDRDVKNLDLRVETEDKNVRHVQVTGNQNLKLGKNVVYVWVTAQDGTTKRYVIYVKRGNVSSNTNILSVKGVTLNKAYSNNESVYFAKVPAKTSVVNLQVETEDKDAVVSVYNTKFDVDTNYLRVRVVVSAPDGSRRDVVLYVHREKSKDDNSVLDKVSISGDFRLNEVFSPNTLHYTSNWRGDVSALTLDMEEYVQVKMSGTSADGKKLIGTLRSQYREEFTSRVMNSYKITNLAKGLNTLKVELKDPNGNKKVYTFEITK